MRGRRRRGADPAGGLLQGQEREEIPPGDRVRERPLGHPGRHRPLHGQGFFQQHPHDPDGADHHVKPPQGAQVRQEQKYPGHRRFRQWQDEIFCQAQPAPVPFLLCGHGPQGHHPERGGRSAGPQGIPH